MLQIKFSWIELQVYEIYFSIEFELNINSTHFRLKEAMNVFMILDYPSP